MIRLFAGFDPREAIGFHAFVQSVIETCSEPVQIIPLTGDQKDGTNSFTYARFLVPELCGFAGHAIFADASDMICIGDLAEIWAMRDASAVQVVKHDYQTKHPVKYVGTELESANQDYPRKNWSSLILWNCGHWDHFKNRDRLTSSDGKYLHRFEWLRDDQIGELPKEWNILVGEQEIPRDAKLLHYTLGIPGFAHYANQDGSEYWKSTVRRAMRGTY